MINDKYQRKYYSTKKGKEARARNSKKYYATPKGYRNQYRKWARARGMEFGLDMDEFMEFWQKPCTYCGSDIATVGIDRVDNNLGHIEGNMVSCCNLCNRMKLHLTVEEWLDHLDKILTYTSSNNKEET